MDYTLRLGFLTANDKTVNVNISKANPAITGAEVLSAMNRILNTRIIDTKAGEPVVIDKAELITSEELVYNL